MSIIVVIGLGVVVVAGVVAILVYFLGGKDERRED
jgi:hypothetical protein